MDCKLKKAAQHPALEELGLGPLQLLTSTAPWKEARTKVRMRPPGLWGNWQNQTSDNNYIFSGEEVYEPGFLPLPLPTKAPKPFTKTSVPVTSSNLLPRRLCGCTSSLHQITSTLAPPYLLAAVLRDLRETVSQVTIFSLAGIKISISFFDWLLITFLSTPIKLPTFSVAYWPFGGPLLWWICSIFLLTFSSWAACIFRFFNRLAGAHYVF